jgi:hypothetical protein
MKRANFVAFGIIGGLSCGVINTATPTAQTKAAPAPGSKAAPKQPAPFDTPEQTLNKYRSSPLCMHHEVTRIA